MLESFRNTPISLKKEGKRKKESLKELDFELFLVRYVSEGSIIAFACLVRAFHSCFGHYPAGTYLWCGKFKLN